MSFEVKLPDEDMALLDEALGRRAAEAPPRARRWRVPARGVLIGSLLGFIAVVILLRSFVFTAGYDTTLVANLGYVRAPFTGVVREVRAEVGDRVRRDQPLGLFAAPVGIAAAISAASEDETLIKARIASLDARIAELSAMAGQVRGDARAFRAGTVALSGADGAEAAADLSAAEARVALAQEQWQRSAALAGRGFLSAANLDKARAELAAARADQARAAARRRGIAIEARAAGQGMRLGNGYGDVSYSTQRLGDITLALSQLKGERDDLSAQLAAQHAPSGRAAAGLDRQVSIPLQASVSGRIWAKAAAAGETVREGEPIYLLADCTSFFAYFTVGRSVYAGLSVGDRVTFIAFSNGDHWPGRIVNLGVNDPAQLRVTSQIEKPTSDRYLVGARIDLHPEDQQACPVGTPGRVVLGGE